MADHNDPLWNPDASRDDDLDRIQRALAPYGVRSRGLSAPVVSATRSWQRRSLPWALAAGIALLLLGGGYEYRLAWTPGSSWTAVRHERPANEMETTLRPGETLKTADDESATISVARIGSIALSPDSSLRLVETETGKHRVTLEHGHMRARIWAPPGYFAVSTGAGEVIDLGCDFDLWKNQDQSGRLFVRSGWVAYRVGTEDNLVPEHYALSFAGDIAQTPLRPDAPAAFVSATHDLDHVIESQDQDASAVDAAAIRVANTARAEDAFTLLSLLSRQPELARTALYPRLGTALGVRTTDPAHRQAWEAGNHLAIDAWWKKMPIQPKRWWVNWTDAL